MYHALLSYCKKYKINDCLILPKQPMAALTTFGIGGPCEVYLVPESESSFLSVLSFLSDRGYPFRFLGNGSNLLIPDEGIECAVLSTRGLSYIHCKELFVTAGAGILLSQLIKRAGESEIGGFESLFGIPATLGGALYMNAGAFSHTVASFVESVRCYSPAERCVFTLSADECEFAYRKSRFQKSGELILSATLKGIPRDSAEIKADLDAIAQKRKEKQPLHQKSAGSTFLRPSQGYAGAYVEGAGLKGFRLGNAAVSDKHAGFIVNLGGATATEVRALIALVKERVFEAFGVTLCEEIEDWGE